MYICTPLSKYPRVSAVWNNDHILTYGRGLPITTVSWGKEEHGRFFTHQFQNGTSVPAFAGNNEAKPPMFKIPNLRVFVASLGQPPWHY